MVKMVALIFLIGTFVLFVETTAKSIGNSSDLKTNSDVFSKRLELMESNIENISEIVKNIVNDHKQERERPMFLAELSDTTELNKYSIVKFDKIIFTEGDDYNRGDGVFIAPISGVFLFSWTLRTYSGKDVFTELRVDDVFKGELNISVGGSGTYTTATKLVLCNVKKGDHVWIQTAGYRTSNYLHKNGKDRSSFMGIFIK